MKREKCTKNSALLKGNERTCRSAINQFRESIKNMSVHYLCVLKLMMSLFDYNISFYGFYEYFCRFKRWNVVSWNFDSRIF